MAQPVEKTGEKTFFQSPLPTLIYVFAAFLASYALMLFSAPYLFAPSLFALETFWLYSQAALLLLALLAAAASILISRSVYCSISPQQLSLTSGILSKNTRSIPLSHVDNFSVSRSPLQSILGLGTLHIDTPGGYGYEAELVDFENSSISHIIDLVSASHSKAGNEA
ncbi:Bacterial PH domain protein [Candidatus Anstonella stagnisolia]|nr:Bacterial PH domain protein [Candidatus Anstonella stagnisolia]